MKKQHKIGNGCMIGNRTYAPDHPTCKSCERQGADICRGQLQAKANKYNARKTVIDGIQFDSKREAVHWNRLKVMERAGVISDLKRQIPFELQPATVLDGRKKPAIRYYADMTYMENGQLVVVDVKGAATRKLSTYRLKKHLLKTVLNIEIQEV